MSTMAPQNASVSIAYSNVRSGADKKTKLRATGLCEGNSPVIGGQ